MMQQWLLLQDLSCQLGRTLAGRPHPEVLGQRQERVLQESSVPGVSPEPIPFSIFMETGKERTENMLIKSASGTQLGRVAKIL